MTQVSFSTTINAPAEKVWFSLWNKSNYENWVSVFYEGSFALSDWNEGSKIHFLSPEGNGMFSIISEIIPNKKITFLHQGEVKDTIEQEVKNEWLGSEESYALIEENGQTTLNVNLTLDEKWQDYFNEKFPKALELVKQDAENGKVKAITVQTLLNKSIEEIWEKYTSPEHIVNWNFASDDWHCPKAVNDLKIGKQFSYTMAAKDGSMEFDLIGTYTDIAPFKELGFYLEDKRKVHTEFISFNDKILILCSFEPESTNSIYLQRDGWQSILNNFKKYCL
ncbi:SRPBCC family protein [Flavobacterium sp. U410]